ncbi:MAG: hypothetical protein HY730_05745 [Candidatus Tectomicrobia bacterium]|uniref:Uncharacterized protein n=1 Tax=Tectimicrobiota bacterium TaxID=2528274 RepID=A0A933GL40_UNCTE|nr:hypothetical protein [Candidatus Tectomicrobia bacterium]
MGGGKLNFGRSGFLLVVLLLLLTLSACQSHYFERTTPIKELLEKPRSYENKVVKIEGVVTEVFSLFVVKYFVVRDNTGEIAVITDRILPGKGERVKVRGHLIEAFALEDKTLMVLKEEKE